MLARLNEYFHVQETALKLRSARQEILASNIANADTPGYKARDVNFSSAFQTALAKGGSNTAMATTSSKHLQSSNSPSVFGTHLMYRGESQSSIDGNTVNMDKEMAEFADNALRYQAALTFMQKRIETMRTAIQGQ